MSSCSIFRLQRGTTRRLRAHRLHHRRVEDSYAALHDIDANKPGGSIKIRVKTYAHSLKLHEERLQDSARRKEQLAMALDSKRLELLELKKKQLEGLKQTDVALIRQIEELAAKVKAYQAPPAAPELPKGIVQLGKKREDGTVVRVQAP
jgi:hypothetical protein